MLAFAAALPHATRAPSGRATCVRMGPWKKGEKDEAFIQQQEILARRRDAKRNKEYFNGVRKRRDEIEKHIDERTLKVTEGEDPLIPWQKMKDAGFIAESGYGEEEEGGIIIPMASFGIPRYDQGGRFDLKLPYVEHGSVDEEADVMAKAGNALKNLFGMGQKPASDSKESDDPS